MLVCPSGDRLTARPAELLCLPVTSESDKHTESSQGHGTRSRVVIILHDCETAIGTHTCRVDRLSFVHIWRALLNQRRTFRSSSLVRESFFLSVSFKGKNSRLVDWVQGFDIVIRSQDSDGQHSIRINSMSDMAQEF